MNIVAWIVLGAVAGYLAGFLVKGDEGLGVVGHVVLGIVGAVVGGFLVGLAENLSLLVISPGYKGAMPFLLLLVILILRPQGIFGEKA